MELGIAEPRLDEQGRSVGLAGYGIPRFVYDLIPYQGTIDEVLEEEWGAMDPSLKPTFDYEIVPVVLPIRDTLVGATLPLIVTANRGLQSVGALEFVLPVERRFAGRQVAVVDIEATRNRDGEITGFLNREVKVITNKGYIAPMIFGLSPFGGVSEHGLNLPLNEETAPWVLNTKSWAAVNAASIWNG